VRDDAHPLDRRLINGGGEVIAKFLEFRAEIVR